MPNLEALPVVGLMKMSFYQRRGNAGCDLIMGFDTQCLVNPRRQFPIDSLLER